MLNLRPITLLNSYYKMLSGCITERIKPKLTKLINADQKGEVIIGEAVRTTFDTMQFAKNNNRSGLILLVDFEKAFDSVSFKFMRKCLQFYNFGPDLIKWVDILMKDFHAVINHCGNISKKFPVLRRCRQGDPISPYCFILACEFLAHKIRSETNIKGFNFGNLENLGIGNLENLGNLGIENNQTVKLTMYADDLTVH